MLNAQLKSLELYMKIRCLHDGDMFDIVLLWANEYRFLHELKRKYV